MSNSSRTATTVGICCSASGAALTLLAFFTMPYLSFWFVSLTGAQVAEYPDLGAGVLWTVPVVAALALVVALAGHFRTRAGATAGFHRRTLTALGLVLGPLLVLMSVRWGDSGGIGLHLSALGMLTVGCSSTVARRYARPAPVEGPGGWSRVTPAGPR